MHQRAPIVYRSYSFSGTYYIGCARAIIAQLFRRLTPLDDRAYVGGGVAFGKAVHFRRRYALVALCTNSSTPNS